MIDVKVFERYLKESNKETSSSQNVIEESCDCDWIIFVKCFLTSALLEQKPICLIDGGKEDKSVSSDSQYNSK